MDIRYAHTNIIARDWRKLAQFYGEVFQCHVKPPKRIQSGPWLDRGTGVRGAQLEGVHLLLPGHGPDGPTLEIYSYGQMAEKPPPRANRQGLGHLAFCVPDVKASLEAVLSHGGKALGQIVHRDIDAVGRLTFVYVTDPEGNIIELQSWAPLPSQPRDPREK